MSQYTHLRIKFFTFCAVTALWLAGCKPGPAAPTPSAQSPEPTSSTAVTIPTPSPPEPTPTSPPLAAKVNGAGITLADFESELYRYQIAAGREPTQEDQTIVLDYLIDQALLAEGAAESGYAPDEADIQARLQALETQSGGPEQLAAWMEANHYSADTLRQQLARAAAASWMRDQIASETPTTGEQVHARQILSRTEAEAADILAQLKNGADFDSLAVAADPLTGGEMGWFGPDGLFDPGLAEAAFKLQPGEFSEVVQTLAGYHIVQVIERDPAHPLDPQALLTAQKQAVENWLAGRRQQSQIEILLP